MARAVVATHVLVLAAALGLSALAGCRPAPVRAFEDFYAATVAKDAAGVRALLCRESRAPLEGVDDDALVAAFSVQKVLRRVVLAPGAPGPDGSVVVVVTDATDGRTSVALRPAPEVPGGYCVLGPRGATP